jgi:hypothetical protein
MPINRGIHFLRYSMSLQNYFFRRILVQRRIQEEIHGNEINIEQTESSFISDDDISTNEIVARNRLSIQDSHRTITPMFVLIEK